MTRLFLKPELELGNGPTPHRADIDARDMGTHVPVECVHAES